ncbi:hypothetical protein ACFX12_035611 [Malus domestica]
MMKLKLKNPSQQEQMVELHNKAEPWIFKPKAGSVFPVKKRAASEFIYEKLKKINKQETTSIVVQLKIEGISLTCKLQSG